MNYIDVQQYQKLEIEYSSEEKKAIIKERQYNYYGVSILFIVLHFSEILL
jgi:hypothetical protein